MGKSHGKKTDQETQSPMFKLFKQMAQKESDDPEKAVPTKEKRRRKRRLKPNFLQGKPPVTSDSRQQSNNGYKSPHSTGTESIASKPRFSLHASIKDYNMQMKGNTDGDDGNTQAYTVQTDKKSDSKCSLRCRLKRMLSNEYACVGCLLFVFTVTVITAFLMVFHTLPVKDAKFVPYLDITAVKRDTNGNHFNLNTAKRDSDSLHDKISAISRTMDEHKRSVWEDGLNDNVPKFTNTEFMDINFGDAGLASSPGDPWSDVLETGPVRDGDSSQQLKEFYAKMIQTDQLIKHLRNVMETSTPYTFNMFSSQTFRYKRNTKTTPAMNRKFKRHIIKHYGPRMNEHERKNMAEKQKSFEVGLESVTDLAESQERVAGNTEKPGNLVQQRQKTFESDAETLTNLVEREKIFDSDMKTSANSVERKKRFDADAEAPTGIVIEKKRILIQYEPEKKSKVTKCSHNPKEGKSHEHQMKHPFYKNSQRLDELLGDYLDKQVMKETVIIDPFELDSKSNKSRKSEHKATTLLASPYKFAHEVSSKAYNQYLRPNFAKAMKLETELVKKLKAEVEKTTSRANKKEHQRSTRMERQEDTTAYPQNPLMIGEILSDKSSNKIQWHGRKLLQSNGDEEESLGYEDLTEVLSDDKDSHDETEPKGERRKRCGDTDSGLNIGRAFIWSSIGSSAPQWSAEDLRFDFEQSEETTPMSTKYTHVTGVQNPNWKGPMPLYPDELSAMMSKSENPQFKLRNPIHNENKERPTDVENSKVNDDYNVVYIEEYAEPKRTKTAQAYSDYGVLNEKKDAIKNEKTLMANVVLSKEVKLKPDNHEHLIKRNPEIMSLKKQLESFDESNEEKEGFKVQYKYGSPKTTQNTASPSKPLQDLLGLLDADDKTAKLSDEEDGFQMLFKFDNTETTQKTSSPSKNQHNLQGQLNAADKTEKLTDISNEETEGFKVQYKFDNPKSTSSTASPSKPLHDLPGPQNAADKTAKLTDEETEGFKVQYGNPKAISSTPSKSLQDLPELLYGVDQSAELIDEEESGFKVQYGKSKATPSSKRPSDSLQDLSEPFDRADQSARGRTPSSEEKEGMKFSFKPYLNIPLDDEIRNSASLISKFMRIAPDRGHTSAHHFTTLVPFYGDYDSRLITHKSKYKTATPKEKLKSRKENFKEDSITDHKRRLHSYYANADEYTDEPQDDEDTSSEETNISGSEIDDNVSPEFKSRVNRDAQNFDITLDIPENKSNVSHISSKDIVMKTQEVKSNINNSNPKNTSKISSNSLKDNNSKLKSNNIVHSEEMVLETIQKNDTRKKPVDFFLMLSDWFSTIAGLSFRSNATGNNSQTTSNVTSVLENETLDKKHISEKSSKTSKDIAYPMYDSDMIDNIAHRSRVLLSVEDSNNRTNPTGKQIGKETKDPSSTVEPSSVTVTYVIIPPTTENIMKNTSEKVENKTEPAPNNSSKIIRKRSPNTDTNLIFWNEMYDEEYGVQDPIDKTVDKHAAVIKCAKNNSNKSANWFERNVQKIKNSMRRSKDDKKVNGKKRSYRNVYELGNFNAPDLTDRIASKNMKVPKLIDGEEETRSTDKPIDFAALNANLKVVCKEAADAVQQTRNLVVHQDDAESAVATGLMQQLVKLMADLVDYQVKQKTCVQLPPDLKEFLEWLTVPNTIAEHKKNLKVIPPGQDTSEMLELATTLSTSSPTEKDEPQDLRSECLNGIRAVSELMQQYTELSEQDKSKMTGVKEYLQNQLDFLNRQLANLNEFDLKSDASSLPLLRYRRHLKRIKKRVSHAQEHREKDKPKRKHRFMKFGRKHTKVTRSHTQTDNLHIDELYKPRDRVEIEAKFMESKGQDKVENENVQFQEKDRSNVKRNLQDVYYKALSDAKKFTTVKSHST